MQKTSSIIAGLTGTLLISLGWNLYLLRNKNENLIPSQVIKTSIQKTSTQLSTTYRSLVQDTADTPVKPEENASLIFANKTPEALAEAEARIDQHLLHSMEKVRDLYLPRFAAMGLSPETQKKLITGILEIEEVRVRSAEQLRELEERRAAYDEQAQNILGEEKYQQYLDEEKRTAPREMLSDFREFQQASPTQKTLTPTQLQQVEDTLTAVAGGGNFRSDFGPYGDLPQVTVGSKRILHQITGTKQYLQSESDYLTQAITDPSIVAAVQAYYADQLAQQDSLQRQVLELEKSQSASN